MNHFTRALILLSNFSKVPIFSLESFLSIVWIKGAFYFQVLREIYEAYVIYCFMR
jgi:hypothetical protein